jgi:regulator of PEP synthase PpsR (kinase-PPPase family)
VLGKHLGQGKPPPGSQHEMDSRYLERVEAPTSSSARRRTERAALAQADVVLVGVNPAQTPTCVSRHPRREGGEHSVVPGLSFRAIVS